ncbi:hypothetical protein [Kitasatospora purpeofusca]|uniref:hypothetical protein n=1 Tax=Kitasatospora purpeofusca TaxID=67352 RepID=UPI0035DAE324
MNDDLVPPPLRREDLLRAAAEAGYVVSERLLETLRSQGLVPRPRRTANNGVRPVWSYPAGTDGQLVAVMAYRARTKDPATLRALLWLDGHAIDTATGREALAAVLDQTCRELENALTAEAERLGKAGPGSRDRALESLAGQLSGRRGSHALPRRVRVKAADRADAVVRLLRAFAFGEQQGVSEDDALMAERVLGISPGRRDRVADAGPWLTGPAAELFEFGADVTSLPAIAGSVAAAGDDELERARVLAQTLAAGLALASRVLDEATGSANRAGLQAVSDLAGEPFVRLLMVGLATSLISRGYAEQLEHVTAAAGRFQPLLGDLDRVLEMPASTVARNLQRAEPEVRASATRLIDAALDGRLKPGPAAAI